MWHFQGIDPQFLRVVPPEKIFKILLCVIKITKDENCNSSSPCRLIWIFPCDPLSNPISKSRSKIKFAKEKAFSFSAKI